MKQLTITILVISFLGLMAYTNPSKEDYKKFIQQQVIEEAQKKPEGVEKALMPLFSGILSDFAAVQTIRKDYIFFSLFKTEMGQEEIVAVGAFNNFFLFQK